MVIRIIAQPPKNIKTKACFPYLPSSVNCPWSRGTERVQKRQSEGRLLTQVALKMSTFHVHSIFVSYSFMR